MIPCEGGWDSHRWEVGKTDEISNTVILFCNQCGCEILAKVDIKGHQWEVGETNEKDNTVYLYCHECLTVDAVCDVLEATA